MWKLCIACITVLWCSITYIQSSSAMDGHLQVTFFACGQGDSFLIRTPEDIRVLVDTCPDGSITAEQLQRTLGFGDQRIDMLILTHGDNDHIGGLQILLSRFHIRSIMAPIETFAAIPKETLHHMAAQHMSTLTADASRDFVFGDITLDILYPDTNHLLDQATDNNSSLVAMLHFGSRKILLTGDAEAALEEHLLSMGTDLRATILKGGHHGSKTSSTESFIEAIQPETVIFQNGAGNSFGHPHPDILRRFEERSIPVYNTSIDGTIVLSCTHSTCSIITQTP